MQHLHLPPGIPGLPMDLLGHMQQCSQNGCQQSAVHVIDSRFMTAEVTSAVVMLSTWQSSAIGLGCKSHSISTAAASFKSVYHQILVAGRGARVVTCGFSEGIWLVTVESRILQ